MVSRASSDCLSRTMATLPRARLLRVLRFAICPRIAAVQPRNTGLLTPCRNLLVAPSRSSSSSYLTRSTTEHLNVLGRRYSGETLNVHELEQRVLNVLKAFDKVNPEKVGARAWLPVGARGINCLSGHDRGTFLERPGHGQSGLC